jgi:peptide/nickel transport system permease protein
MFYKRFVRDKAAVLGIIVVVFVLFIAVFGPALAPMDPNAQDLSQKRAGVSWESPFGRDAFGRDLFSRMLHGARVTVISGVTVVLFSMLIGVVLGILSGYFGGLLDNIVMRVMDFILSMPYFFLAILIISILEPSLENAIIAVTVTKIPGNARVIRGDTMQLKTTGYVEAAIAMGASKTHIVFRHILPNLVGSIIVLSTVGVASAVTMVAALSFLGLGAQPPTAEWGLILSEGRNYVTSDPHMTIIPGIILAVFILGLNLAGDGLRDALDPRLK